MDEVHEIALRELLNKLPSKKIYKDGDEKVECQLAIYYFKKDKKHKWVIGYLSEYNYWLVCGFGDTITKAVTHLQRQLQR